MAKSEIPIEIRWEDVKANMKKHDIVEIIHCRDCVWHEGNVCRNNESIPWSDDDFCSNAERREVSE